eukprot:4827456-Alexandrium_andersonii.AAC.1
MKTLPGRRPDGGGRGGGRPPPRRALRRRPPPRPNGRTGGEPGTALSLPVAPPTTSVPRLAFA